MHPGARLRRRTPPRPWPDRRRAAPHADFAPHLRRYAGRLARATTPGCADPRPDRPHAGRDYYLSANVLKASEDKTFPGRDRRLPGQPVGAGGQRRRPRRQPTYFGSYREVFARDLYESFTGLLAAGRPGPPRRDTVRFLFERQQQPDGSFPRNSLVNGKTRAGHRSATSSTRSAYPILMARQAGLDDRALYRDHIKRAADFVRRARPVVRHGALGGAERLLAVHDRRRDRRAGRGRPRSPSATATPPAPASTGPPPTTTSAASRPGR